LLSERDEPSNSPEKRAFMRKKKPMGAREVEKKKTKRGLKKTSHAKRHLVRKPNAINASPFANQGCGGRNRALEKMQRGGTDGGDWSGNLHVKGQGPNTKPNQSRGRLEMGTNKGARGRRPP